MLKRMKMKAVAILWNLLSLKEKQIAGQWKWKWQQQTFIMHRLFKWSEVNKNICNLLIIIRSYFSQPHTGYCHHFFIHICYDDRVPALESTCDGCHFNELRNPQWQRIQIYIFAPYFFLERRAAETMNFSWNKWYCRSLTFKPKNRYFWVSDGNVCVCVSWKTKRSTNTRSVHTFSINFWKTRKWFICLIKAQVGYLNGIFMIIFCRWSLSVCSAHFLIYILCRSICSDGLISFTCDCFSVNTT